jgi:hypothetical protein
MSATSTILLSSHAQIGFDVSGTDSVQANPMTSYMVEKMAAIANVRFDGPSAEVALAQVFAQRDQPMINPMLFCNVVSPGGGCQ